MSFNPADPAAKSLTLHTHTAEDNTIVKCQGRLTTETADFLKTKIQGMIPGKKPIVLDLSDLVRMDSSGLGTVIGLCISARRAGCELTLINLSKQVRELLGLTNLLSVFEVCAQNGLRMP